LIVHYEQLEQDPTDTLARVFTHFGLAMPQAVIARAVAAGSKAEMAAKLNPEGRRAQHHPR
jgi:DnaJ-domain-containing protein 1